MVPIEAEGLGVNRQSFDIAGPGVHAILPATEGRVPIISRATITFSHESTRALKVIFWSGPRIMAGPYYVLDGHRIDYVRGDAKPFYIEAGETFSIELDDGLAAAGMVEYEIGGK